MPKVDLWYPRVEGVNLELHEATWLAALIDGEGCITILKQTRKENTSGWKYRPVVEIHNTHMGLLQKVASLVPGWIGIKDRRKDHPEHKVKFVFSASTKCMVALLDEVAPFLLVKPRQAAIVRQMCELMHSGSNRLSASNHEVYERMAQEIRALNRRGSPGA